MTYHSVSGRAMCHYCGASIKITGKCPQCGSTLFKKGGRSGLLVCEKEGCGYSSALGAEKKE